MNFPVNKYMTDRLITVNADDLLEDAYRKLKIHHIRHLPVVDECGDIIGIMSERDFQRGMLHAQYDCHSEDRHSVAFIKNSKVCSFMSWPVKTVSPSESLINVCKKMINDKISALVIMDNDYITGIITHEDLLKMLVGSLTKQETNAVQRLEAAIYNSPIGQISKFLSDSGI